MKQHCLRSLVPLCIQVCNDNLNLLRERIHLNWPRANPSFVHCTAPLRLATLHCRMAVSPWTTVVFTGASTKDCCTVVGTNTNKWSKWYDTKPHRRRRTTASLSHWSSGSVCCTIKLRGFIIDSLLCITLPCCISVILSTGPYTCYWQTQFLTKLLSGPHMR